jgi:hypothetical protein
LSPLDGEEVLEEAAVHGPTWAPFSGVNERREDGVEDARSRVDFVERCRESMPRRSDRSPLERVLVVDPPGDEEGIGAEMGGD